MVRESRLINQDCDQRPTAASLNQATAAATEAPHLAGQVSTSQVESRGNMGYSDKRKDSPVLFAPAKQVNLPLAPGRRLRFALPAWVTGRSQGSRPLSTGNTAYGTTITSFRKRLLAAILLIILSFIFVASKVKRSRSFAHLPFVEESTLVINSTHVGRIWAYEIAAGHYPSRRPLPHSVRLPNSFKRPYLNPGLPSSWSTPAGRVLAGNTSVAVHRFQGAGQERSYLPLRQPSSYERTPDDAHRVPYPPRPLPRSAIDLDVVMAQCDFSLNKYVRDCLEMLRLGAGLDPLQRVRRGQAAHWHHLFRDQDQSVANLKATSKAHYEATDADVMEQLGYRAKAIAGELPLQRTVVSDPPIPTAQRFFVGAGPKRNAHPSHITADPACDPDRPKIFHVFWAGPFTDKPYLAALSFLFTQNLGLHMPMPEEPNSFRDPLDPLNSERDEFLSEVCRPQLWFWINPGPAASVPNPSARANMFDALAENPWSAPFLHRRFEEVIKFKLWNTTEQLDGVPELRDSWRSLPLFNSGGVKYNDGQLRERQNSETNEAETLGLANTTAVSPPGPSPTRFENKKEDDFFQRVGSTSASGYDRLSVVLSDMARFVLCHRFGGVYLDADTIFLRDWEELWGWNGAFAYRWSRLEKYNTAVLKLHRNSAIGSFLFKTALANGLDFHPMTISRYTKDAELEGLLLRLPDALFDPAWLNTEYYQRDRPSFPYMKRFEDFFDPPSEANAAPAAVGFDGFFKGAFSYHFHNFWWIPFDPARNWPDLGPRFAAGERKARLQAMRGKIAAGQMKSSSDLDLDADYIEEDQKDLGWATVLKRTFESYLRGERPNMYGEYLTYDES